MNTNIFLILFLFFSFIFFLILFFPASLNKEYRVQIKELGVLNNCADENFLLSNNKYIFIMSNNYHLCKIKNIENSMNYRNKYYLDIEGLKDINDNIVFKSNDAFFKDENKLFSLNSGINLIIYNQDTLKKDFTIVSNSIVTAFNNDDNFYAVGYLGGEFKIFKDNKIIFSDNNINTDIYENDASFISSILLNKEKNQLSFILTDINKEYFYLFDYKNNHFLKKIDLGISLHKQLITYYYNDNIMIERENKLLLYNIKNDKINFIETDKDFNLYTYLNYKQFNIFLLKKEDEFKFYVLLKDKLFFKAELNANSLNISKFRENIFILKNEKIYLFDII